MKKPRKKIIPQLPAGCGYEGRDFGASYIDSKCYGGKLYDLDNCDDRGNLFEPLDYIACPQCQHESWRERFEDQVESQGYEAAEAGKSVKDCPYPKEGLRYPQDNDWLKKQWLKGFNAAVRDLSHQKS